MKLKPLIERRNYLLPKENPKNNDIILVPGIGTMTLKQLRNMLETKVKSLLSMIKSDNYTLGESQLNVIMQYYKTLQSYKNKKDLPK